jgi:hypothetical protein
MQRTLLLTMMVLAAAVVPSFAQQQISNDANPLYRAPSIRTSTISVPPIPGAPFSATARIESQQTMPDGSVLASRDVNLIGRDSRGRTHGEMRPRVPITFQGMPPLSEVHIFDPETSVRTIYYPATHVASSQTVSPPRIASNLTDPHTPLVRVEDLGSSIIDNIDVQGARRTLTIPAPPDGTSAAITVVDEYWYSPDLHVNLLLRHNDPRTGMQTVTLTDIKREEPAPEFFQIPDGYKNVDMTPPEAK